jgi:hypothetical protein
MNRASIALVLSLTLLSVSSPQAPTVEHHRVAFSYRGRAEGYGPVPISEPLPVASGDAQQDAATLQGGTAHIYQDGAIVWTSDPTWDVRQLLVADVDNDGQQEVALALWKPYHREPAIVFDTYHFSSPWEEGSLCNHLFVYGWREDGWQPLWCSSPIPDPIREMAAGDVDGDRANELVVLEGSYADTLDAPPRHVAVWRWNGWGFGLQWRSPASAYRHLTLCDANGDEILDIVTEQR